jgi:hypothetical protein
VLGARQSTAHLTPSTWWRSAWTGLNVPVAGMISQGMAQAQHRMAAGSTTGYVC